MIALLRALLKDSSLKESFRLTAASKISQRDLEAFDIVVHSEQ